MVYVSKTFRLYSAPPQSQRFQSWLRKNDTNKSISNANSDSLNVDGSGTNADKVNSNQSRNRSATISSTTSNRSLTTDSSFTEYSACKHSVYLEAKNKRQCLALANNKPFVEYSLEHFDETWLHEIKPEVLSYRIDDCYGVLGTQQIRGVSYLVAVNGVVSIGKLTDTAEIFVITSVLYVNLKTGRL